MIRLRPSGADEVLIKRVQDWYEPGPGVFIQSLTASFSPAMLFTGSTTGAWYDPSDLTTLYRDAAGTLPVTDVEQPVGRMLDKSGKGNHAFNSSGNSANFPVLSARYNLLTKTEDFSDAVWSKVSAGASIVTPNSAVAPNGTTSADTLIANNSGNVSGIAQSNLDLYVNGVVETFSVYAKKGTSNFVVVRDLRVNANTAGTNKVWFNLNTGTVGTQQSAVSGSITSVGDGWFKCSITGTVTTNVNRVDIQVADADGSDSVLQGNYIYIWGADLRVANDALNQPDYQRVNTSSDYDTVGFKRGEVFDGINDYLTASAGGGSTTSFFWCSAIRVGKVGAVQTLFSDAGTNTGYRVRINASNQLELSAGNGASYTTVSTTATLSIGQRAVITAWHDGTNLNVQINNGTVHQVAFSTATAGTAQFTIGKDNNAASNFFAGWLYEKVYTKDNVPSSAQIADTKAYVANIAGITL